LAIPLGKDDLDGSFLNAVANGVPLPDPINYCSLNTLLPFFMAISRDQFMAIGGYDEDFSGIFYDDDDLVERLISNGCYYFQTDALVIHLFHPRYPASVLESQEGLYNKNLYLSRKGIIVRNQGREWGRL
jgi:GT2 family glycosyltransferase